MKNTKILISGASVAGNTAAWWLSRYGFEVTVIEKFKSFRDGGQNVDVRGAARTVVQKMGLEKQVIDATTGELGTDWVDQDDRVIGRFAVKDIGDGPTAELEIMRGSLSKLIYESTKEKVNYRFGDPIVALTEVDSSVNVRFSSGAEDNYNIVIIAEGVGSTSRELIFPGENKQRFMDLTIAYFGIPGKKSDGKFSRQYNTTGGRGATVKPGLDGKLHAYIGVQKISGGENEWSVEQQKDFIREQFKDVGWEFPRILDGMDQTNNFYFDVLRQVKMQRWFSGRIVLSGDAAWCATPLSGIGTSLALVGGYVLAGELAQASDYRSAFASYERIMRPFVKEGQGLPKWVVRFLWPQRKIGLSFLRGAIRVASTPSLRKLFSKLYVRNSKRVKLPDYKI